MKNIYRYLEEIDFEYKVKEKAELFRRIKNSNNDYLSDFVQLQAFFTICNDLYLAIYNDVEVNLQKIEGNN